MFRRLGLLASSYPKATIVLWLLVLAVSVPFSSKLQDNLAGGDLAIQTSESAQADSFIAEHFEGVSASRLIIVAESKETSPEASEFRQFVERLRTVTAGNPDVSSISDPYAASQSGQLDSDARRAFIYANLDMEEQQSRKFIKQLREDIKDVTPDGYTVKLTGSPAMNAEGSQIAKNNVKTVEKIGLPFVFILLLIVFRSVVAALLPLLTGVIAIVLAMAAAFFFSKHMDLSSLLTNIITMLGLGIAIDYALFITQRYRDELASGKDTGEAAVSSVATAGRSVFFAGVTVAISTVSILFSNTAFARSIALGGTLVVIAAVVVSVTLLPAVLTLIGKRIDALAIPFLRRRKEGGGSWRKSVIAIMQRPLLYLVLALIPIGVFIPPLFQIELHLPAANFNELPEDSEARQGMEAVTEQMGAGTLFPVKLLLQSSGNVFEPASMAELRRITDQIHTLPNVKEVQSILSFVTPERTAEQWRHLIERGDELQEPIKSRMQSFVSRDARSTLLYIVPEMEASSAATRALVDSIKDHIMPGISSQFTGSVTGATASGLDYDAEVLSHIPIIVSFVLVLTFLLLYAAFRSIVIPLVAIIMNLFVTASTFGFIVLMYQYGYMPGAESFPLNINTPLTLFVLLFGLSMDYEVILISRMREYYKETGQHEESVTDGIVTTAGMINGAASIMVVVFGVFLLADFQLIEELGVGLAFAILIDAFLVRTLLVPISMKLLGKYNWWSFTDWLSAIFTKQRASVYDSQVKEGKNGS
ncbi:MMPL family transporter [Paenibacillus xylaniclasticus]|uniref:MMPL family transporter n=1 Tax=Paenibacillus xylaniclasticus TaxID=588083 RepID=UPI000FD7C0CD|nr:MULTISPECIES: MMPL family transporter [Paenibacillus]GFN32247.1 membrane protein [Paenibacillus curdlanolyticus]